MRTYGLLGYPLSHSFSQSYFTKKFIEEGLEEVEYKNFSLPTIKDVELILTNKNLCGFNITIPYKKLILPYLHEANPTVIAMGACNCVKIINNQLWGYNTDVIGFEKSVKPYLKPHHKKALILGTGGAAAAVEFVLKKNNISYQFVSRTASETTLAYQQLTEQIIAEHSLIINTSPLGQYPAIEASPNIPYQYIGTQHHLFDLVYNPEETSFLQKGKAQGATIQNGYNMLVIQAEESWEIWNA
jgi:shikimate dehydrogenase